MPSTPTPLSLAQQKPQRRTEVERDVAAAREAAREIWYGIISGLETMPLIEAASGQGRLFLILFFCPPRGGRVVLIG